MRTVKHRNKLHRHVVQPSFLETFKMHLNKALSNQVWIQCWSCLKGGTVTRDLLTFLSTWVSLQFNDSTNRLQKTFIPCRGISGVEGAGTDTTRMGYHFLPVLQLLSLRNSSPHSTQGPWERKMALACTPRWRPDPGHWWTHQSTAIFSSTSGGMAYGFSEVSLTSLPATPEHSGCSVL